MAGQHCNTTVNQLIVKFNSSSLRFDDVSNLSGLCDVAYEKEADDRFSEPLVGIGMYIAAASAACFLAMVADFVFVWKRVGQIPYGHFPLNALAITVLSIAMKLPLDMTGSMPGFLDQATKLGSIVFMCSMMANLIPSLASMNCKTLVSNITALAIVVITIIGNLLIEMITGVVDGHRILRKLLSSDDQLERSTGYRYDQSIFHGYFAVMAYLYIGSMLFLLAISVSAAVAIPSMKTILESKYQVKRKALDSKEPTTIVELKQHVSKYWIMANTGSLPVVFTSGPLFATSLSICIVCSVTYVILRFRRDPFGEKYASDYKWSMRVIFVVQSLGIAAGDCTLILRYYKSSKIFRNYYNPTRVEEFWYAKLCEWKGRHIRLTAAADLRAETVVHTVRGTFLNLLIMFQYVFVLIYKFLGSASLIILVINYVFKRIRSRPIASSGDEDLYALCVEGDVKVYRYAMHYLKESMDQLVKKAEKKQNTELLKLLKKSNGFKEGQNFAIGQVQIPPSVELKSWSLPVITLTCIAIVFTDRQETQDQLIDLIKSVEQALEYTHLVEEGFQSEDEYANMHKKTMDFWYKVKTEREWLKTSLERDASHFQGKTPTQILKWFDDKVEEAIGKNKSTVVDMEPEPLENDKLMICMSMQSISRSIFSKYENGSQLSTKVDFFQLLSSMIADILFACFSNIPQVITRKCHAEEIEKREASVEAAVKILARTTKILEIFGTPKLPILDQHKMESIHEWRHPLIQPPTDPELSAV